MLVNTEHRQDDDDDIGLEDIIDDFVKELWNEFDKENTGYL